MKRSFCLICLPLILAACTQSTADSGSASQAVGAGDPDVGLVIETGLNELELGGFGDKQRAEAVSDAFAIMKEKLGNPEDAQKLNPEDVAKALTAGQDNLSRVNTALAKQGIDPVSNLLPSGFFAVFGGGGNYAAGIGGGGGTGIFVVVLPKRIERMYQKPDGTLKYERYWRLKFGVSGYGAAQLTLGAATGGQVRAGFGAIWLGMAEPSDFTGNFVGASLALSVGAGIDLKAGLLMNHGKYNVLGMVEWEGGPIAEAGLHIEGMRIVSGKTIASAIGGWLGGDESGPKHEDAPPSTPKPGTP